MTLEGWTSEVVRPIMEKHPWAWAVFVPYIVIVTFAVLNLFIGIIVDAMQQRTEQARDEVIDVSAREYTDIIKEIKALRSEIKGLRGRPDDA